MAKEWAKLKKGDLIQVIAPASRTPDPSADVKQVKDFLENWGLQVKISDIIFGEDANFPNLANTDEKRFEDLKNALLDPTVKAIWCIRGGYGCIRLIKSLQEKISPKNISPKLFIGFSDITLLLIYFRQVWQWNTIHGPGPLQSVQNRVDGADIERLRQLMFGEVSETIIDDLIPLNTAANQQKIINGEVTGGNLTLLSRTFGLEQAGMRWDIANKIAVFEDQNEPFRKIDGIFQQMILQEYFFSKHKPAAVIMGNFTIHDPLEQPQVENVLKELALRLDEEGIPAFRCINIGHGSRNHPLPLGPSATLQFGEKAKLIIQSGCKMIGGDKG